MVFTYSKGHSCFSTTYFFYYRNVLCVLLLCTIVLWDQTPASSYRHNLLCTNEPHLLWPTTHNDLLFLGFWERKPCVDVNTVNDRLSGCSVPSTYLLEPYWKKIRLIICYKIFLDFGEKGPAFVVCLQAACSGIFKDILEYYYLIYKAIGAIHHHETYQGPSRY